MLASRSTRPRAAVGSGLDTPGALGATLLAIFLVYCGMEHFAYTDFVTGLIPRWIAGRRFWTYFAGVSLVAGGTGMLVPTTARLASTLSALMIFSWVPLVHIPRAFGEPTHAAEAAGVFEALAISGVALCVAGTRARPRNREG